MNSQQLISYGSPQVDHMPIDRRFERALFAFHSGEYTAALRDFERTCQMAAAAQDYGRYVDSCSYFLRILAEREEFARIERIEKHVLGLLTSVDEMPNRLPIKLKSRALYILGICSCYQETRHESAMRRFHEAIECAMQAADKEALAAPLYGAATVHYGRGRYGEALRELDRLAVLLSCLDLPDLNSASFLLRAMVHRNQGDLDGALESAWKAFDYLKHHPHLVLYLHTLCVLGTIYRNMGDLTSARLYLDLADRSLRREELPRIARLIDEAVKSIGADAPENADLIFEKRGGSLIERHKGEIRFDGQFILRDLMRLFLENVGRVFTKQDLVALVWREKYSAKTHDNKIYVTIKRLRALLESDACKTDYILRAKTGYFLNPNVRVLITDNENKMEKRK